MCWTAACQASLEGLARRLKSITRAVRAAPQLALIPLGMCVVCMTLGVWAVVRGANADAAAVRNAAANTLDSVVRSLELTFTQATLPVRQLADIIHHIRDYPTLMSMWDDWVPNWWSWAPAGALSLRLTSQGIVSNIYPPTPKNLALIHVDVLGERLREDSLAVMQANRTMLSGPFPQANSAANSVLVRIPVYITNVSANETWNSPWKPNACPPGLCWNETTRTKWWGFSVLSLDLDAMLLGSDNVSLLEDLSSKGLSYRLTRPGNQTAAGGPPVDPIVIYQAGRPYNSDALCKVVHLLEDEWELCAWKASWWPSYTPPLIAVVVVVVLMLTVAVFMVLLSRQEHRVLLLSLLPKATILKMQAEIDWEADATAIDEQLGMMASGTPAEQMLVVIEDVLMGRPPALPTVMAVRSALQQSLDVYKPLQEDLSQRMANTGNLDSEVHEALMQQLMGRRAGRERVSQTGTEDRATPQLFSGAVINDSTRPSDLDDVSNNTQSFAFTTEGGVSSSFLFQPAKVQSPTGGDPKPKYQEHSTIGDLPLLAARGPNVPKLPPLPQTASLQQTNRLAHLLVDGAEQGRGLDRVEPGPLTLPGARSPQNTPASSAEGSQIAMVPQGALALGATEAASALPAVPEPPPAGMELSTFHAADLASLAREVVEHVPCQGTLIVSWMLQQPAVERTPPCCGAELLHSLDLRRHGTSVSSHASVVLRRVIPAQAAAPQPLAAFSGTGGTALAALAASSSPQHLGGEAGREASKDSDRQRLLQPAVGQRQSTEATVSPGKSASPVSGVEQGKSVAGEPGTVSTPPLNLSASKDLKSEAALGRSNQFMMNGARVAGPMHTFQLAPAGQQRLAKSEESPGKGSQLGQVPKQLEDALDSASKWAFDAFTLDAAACGHPLSILAFWVLQQSGLCSWARLDESKLARWLCRIEEGYAANPYHNRIHAADVVQSMHMLLTRGGLAPGYADQLTMLAAYLAAVCHDYQHIGRTNDWLVNTHDELAVRYNDRSPMENHHLAGAFSLLRDPDLNFLHAMPKSSWERLRKLMIDMVLGTDMKQHFSIMGQFTALHRLTAADSAAKSALSELKPQGNNSPSSSVSSYQYAATPPGEIPGVRSKAVQPLSDTDKLLGLQMALKCCDLGHLSAPLYVHLNWVERLETEFFLQGDSERAQGLAVSPLCDRTKQGITKSQVGFFDFVALPLFNNFVARFKSAKPLLRDVMRNYRHWQMEAEASSQALTPSHK